MCLPVLNIILANISQRQLFRINIALFVIYWIINFIKTSFFWSHIITFLTIYFFTAYIKKYMKDKTENIKYNAILLAGGIICFIILTGLTNFLGLKVKMFDGQMLHWCKNVNPILLMIAFALFNIFKNMKLKSSIINFLASLTLFIYIVHENIIVRQYIRIDIWKWIYNNFSFNNVVLEALIFSIGLFSASIVISIIYKYSIRILISNAINKLYEIGLIRKIYKKVENKIVHDNTK